MWRGPSQVYAADMQITERVNAPLATSYAASRWVLPGLTAGAAFLGFEMLAGSLSTSIWAFPQAVAQTIGIGSPTQALAPASLLAGIAIHLAFSVGLGILFIALARRFSLTGRRLVAAGVLYMWAESTISIWLVLHTLVPDALPVLLGAVPFWASFLGRSGFGVILALMYARQWR
jgi:hypothetical protein